jgi:L-arabinonolactonase
MPMKLVSSAMFGGPELNRLFVATIADGALDELSESRAGALYVIKGLGARGVPENCYAG